MIARGRHTSELTSPIVNRAVYGLLKVTLADIFANLFTYGPPEKKIISVEKVFTYILFTLFVYLAPFIDRAI